MEGKSCKNGQNYGTKKTMVVAEIRGEIVNGIEKKVDKMGE